MDQIKFSSLEELYDRIRPALRSKIKELKNLKKIYIREEDIFEYLAENKWNNSIDLTLADMVSDILYLDNEKLDEYVQKKILKSKLRSMEMEDK